MDSPFRKIFGSVFLAFFARKAVYIVHTGTQVFGVGFVGSLENLGKDKKKVPRKRSATFYAPTKLKTPDVEGQPDRVLPMMTTSKPRAVLRGRSAFFTVRCEDASHQSSKASGEGQADTRML